MVGSFGTTATLRCAVVLRFLPQPLSSAEAQAMEALHIAELCRRYEIGLEEGDPPEEPGAFAAEAGGAFLVGWLETDGGESQAVAMGGVRRLGDDGRAELKRMFVVEEARG